MKSKLHPRNKNKDKYDLKSLVKISPELKNFIVPNKKGEDSIDFSNPSAVKSLNKAILNHSYGIENWDFPNENLCPPIPGRADYIHYIADILSENNFGKIPTGKNIKCFDVGVGASCIYPIIGVIEYGWNFLGSDIDPKSILSAENIVLSNSGLKGNIECRLQKKSKDAFYGIILRDEKFEAIICNPPFHASIKDAEKGTRRKVRNLSGKNTQKPELNFAGISNELVCDGGENKFIQNMISESEKFSKNCFWFSSLVSKQSNLKGIYKSLELTNATHVRTIPMGTGNKSTRIVAWTYLNKKEMKAWREERWSD